MFVVFFDGRVGENKDSKRDVFLIVGKIKACVLFDYF